MRNTYLASLLTLVSLSLASASRADETLNIQLPPSHLSQASHGGGPASSTTVTSAATPAASAASQSNNTDAQRFEDYLNKKGAAANGRSFASRGGSPTGRPGANRSAGASKSGQEKVVGRLGVTARGATIRSGRGARKRSLAKVKPGTYIAINSESGDWYGVLMSDHSTGWVSKNDIQVLNYEVVTPKDYDPAPYRDYASNGGSELLTGGQKGILDYAYTFLGVPYKWGGTSPDGLDCSAFVQRCFATQGIQLPRTAHEQIGCGMPISAEELRAGDRLYFASRDGHISHTGIYVGNGYFIHSSSSHHGVAVSNLTEAMYSKMYAGARR